MRTFLRLITAAIIVIGAAAAQPPAPSLEGSWGRTRVTPAGSLRLVLRIEKSADGLLTGVLDSVDQGSKIPIESVTLAGESVKLDVRVVKGTFEGTLNAARTEIKGTWNQGAPLPLVFTRDAGVATPPGPAPAATDASAPVVAARFPMGLPLDLQVPVAPVTFQGDDGKSYLV